MGLFSKKTTASKNPIRPTLSRSPTSTNSVPANGATSASPLPRAPDPLTDPAGYLRSLNAVRERSRIVYEQAKRNQLRHFTVDMTKLGDTAQYVCSIIKRDFAPDYASIPPHGRWQHFNVGGRPRVENLMMLWETTIDDTEKTRRLVDLFLVSVLLDAGAGNEWQYKTDTGKVLRRSEGLAVASLDMFRRGLFSSDLNQPFRVDAAGLGKLTLEDLAKSLQITPQNPISGLEGRTNLLIRLSDALRNTLYFGEEGRPGNMIDYLIAHPTTQMTSVPVVLLPTLWEVLMDGLAPIWPGTRTQIDGTSIGDAWPCSLMPSHPTHPWENIVPFHKLTQWLTYSLMVPMQKYMKMHFIGTELLTGLPEYRNGGLLIDTGLLSLKPEDLKRGLKNYTRNAQSEGQPSVEVVPMFTPDDDVIVEWRAVTIGFLDELLKQVNLMLDLEGPEALSLAQMLEAGTWKGGREIAEVSRPNTKEPPIMILSDGTVF